MSSEIVFYKEWLALPKSEFRILAIAADHNPFKGNLSDMCRYFNSGASSNNRRRLRDAIGSLSKTGFIEHKSQGNTHTIKIIPKGTEITMKKKWFQEVKNHNYSADSVSWEVVIKVFLWLSDNGTDEFINNTIATDLNISDSSVVAAKNVLEKDFNSILKDYVYYQLPTGELRRRGQTINLNAWWNV